MPNICGNNEHHCQPPPCQLILIFTVCNGWDIFIYSMYACLLLHPVTALALHGIIRIGFERLDTKYVD